MTEYGTQSSIYILVSYILSRLTFNVFFWHYNGIYLVLFVKKVFSILVVNNSCVHSGAEQNPVPSVEK